MRRIWAVAGLAILAATLGVAEAPGQESGQPKGGRRGRDQIVMDLVVDGEVRHQWSHQELRGLATETWTNQVGADHPGISVWRLLGTRDLTRQGVAEVRVKSKRDQSTFAGDELPRLDGMMLRTGKREGRVFWELVPVDVSNLKKRKLGGTVSAIEVVTKKP